VIRLALLFLLGASPIEIVGASGCPSRGDVEAALARLEAPAPAAAAGGARLVADLASREDGLAIVLRDGDGRLLAERFVARGGDCAQLAAAAAVVITAWQSELRTDLGPPLPATAAGAPPPAPAVAAAVSRAASAPRDRGGRPFELGAAVAAGAAGGDLSARLELDAQAGRPGSALAGRLAASVERPHGIALGPAPGQSRWSRAAVSLGVRARTFRGDVALDGHVDLLGAAVFVEGTGFDHDYQRAGFDLALGAGVRLALTAGRVAPFVGIGAALWPARSTVAVTGTPAEAALPRLEVGAAAGVSFGRFR
jgi:hypothetical protein